MLHRRWSWCRFHFEYDVNRNFANGFLPLLDYEICFSFFFEKYEETARHQRSWRRTFYLGHITFTPKMAKIKIQV